MSANSAFLPDEGESMGEYARKSRKARNEPTLFDITPPTVTSGGGNGGSLRIVGLFAGIGGIELGLQEAGHRSELLCEIDEGARAVLAAHFPQIALHADVRQLQELPAIDLVTAG